MSLKKVNNSKKSKSNSDQIIGIKSDEDTNIVETIESGDTEIVVANSNSSEDNLVLLVENQTDENQNINEDANTKLSKKKAKKSKKVKEVKVPKKRGRKPKIKTEADLVVKVPKKRGRKPKPKSEKEIKKPSKRGRKPKKNKNDIPKVKKKRGRKPREKYGVYGEDSNNGIFNVKKENIIIHLPISSDELKSRESLENKYLSYDPTINEPMPYEPNIKMAMYPFNKNSKDGNEIDNLDSNLSENIQPLSQNNELNLMNNSNLVGYDSKSLNNNQTNNEEKGLLLKSDNSLNKLKQSRQTDILYSSKTKRDKHTHILVQMKEANRRNEWPKSTHISCFWCTHQFDTIPLGLPIKFSEGKFKVVNIYCSLECMAAYTFKNYIGDELWNIYSNINLLARRLYQDFKGNVKLAPSPMCIERFGGPMSIEEYRESLNNYDINYQIKIPPMTSIIPIMEEINTSSLKYKNKYIPVDKDRIRKANNELRLKRSKPVSEHKNTLDSCMSLKYM